MTYSMKDAIIRKKITENVISLENFGLHDLTWNKKDALELLKNLMSDDIAVLGGDVYILKKDSVEPTYDNWHCDRKDNETKHDFNIRSKNESIRYIESYGCACESTIFSIVFTELVW